MGRMPREPVSDFDAAALRARRRELGWTQEDLALHAGVAGATVASWETRVAAPSPTHLVTVANALRVPMSRLLVPAGSGTSISDYRLRTGLTRAEAAAAADLPASRLKDIERHMRQPNTEDLAALSDAYGVPTATLSAAWATGREARLSKVHQS